jgi:hypothetical protein
MTNEEFRKLPFPEHLPDNLRVALADYVVKHNERGGFLMALLEGRLFDAACRADNTNRLVIGDLARWIVHYLPLSCYGSPERVAAHLAAGRQESGGD